MVFLLYFIQFNDEIHLFKVFTLKMIIILILYLHYYNYHHNNYYYY